MVNVTTGLGSEPPTQLALIAGASAAGSLVVLVLTVYLILRYVIKCRKRAKAGAANKVHSTYLAEAANGVAPPCASGQQISDALSTMKPRSGGSDGNYPGLFERAAAAVPASLHIDVAIAEVISARPGHLRRSSSVMPLSSVGPPEYAATPPPTLAPSRVHVMPAFNGPERGNQGPWYVSPPQHQLDCPLELESASAFVSAGSTEPGQRRQALPSPIKLQSQQGERASFFNVGALPGTLHGLPSVAGAYPRADGATASVGAVLRGAAVSGLVRRRSDIAVPADRSRMAWGIGGDAVTPADTLDSLLQVRRRQSGLELLQQQEQRDHPMAPTGTPETFAANGLAGEGYRSSGGRSEAAAADSGQQAARGSSLAAAASRSFYVAPSLLSPGSLARRRRASVA